MTLCPHFTQATHPDGEWEPWTPDDTCPELHCGGHLCRVTGKCSHSWCPRYVDAM